MWRAIQSTSRSARLGVGVDAGAGPAGVIEVVELGGQGLGGGDELGGDHGRVLVVVALVHGQLVPTHGVEHGLVLLLRPVDAMALGTKDVSDVAAVLQGRPARPGMLPKEGRGRLGQTLEVVGARRPEAVGDLGAGRA